MRKYIVTLFTLFLCSNVFAVIDSAPVLSGTLPPDIIISSVGANTIGDMQLQPNASFTTSGSIDSSGDIEANTFTVDSYIQANTAIGLSGYDDGGNLGWCVEDGGFVGIGTTNPGAKISVYRNDSNTSPTLRLEQDSTGTNSLDFYSTDVGRWTMGYSAATANADALHIGRSSTMADDTSYLTIYKDRGVGIFNDSPSTTAVLQISTGSWSGATALFVQRGSGNIGVGSTAPTAKLDVVGRIKLDSIYHVYGGTQASQNVLPITQDVYRQVGSVTSGLLWNSSQSDGFTMTTDSMTIVNTADYFGTVSISFSGTNANDISFRIYNITQARQEGYTITQTATGAGNFNCVVLPVYIEATAGDVVVVQCTNLSGSNSITIKSAQFYLMYAHD